MVHKTASKVGYDDYRELTVGLARNHAKWSGRVRPYMKGLLQPLSWPGPGLIQVNYLSDLLADGVDDSLLDYVWAVMALQQKCTFLICTKREQRLFDYLTRDVAGLTRRIEAIVEDVGTRAAQEDVAFRIAISQFAQIGFLPNVWLAVSVENQQWANERVPVLCQMPAAVRAVIGEPLLGPIRLEAGWLPHIGWIVTGGEQGNYARPSRPEWFHGLRDQAAGASIPYMHLRFGRWRPFLPSDSERRCMVWPVNSAGVVRRDIGIGATIYKPDEIPMVKSIVPYPLLDGVRHEARPPLHTQDIPAWDEVDIYERGL